MSLGATTKDVLRMVLGEGVRLTAAGLGIGLLCSLGAGKLLSSLLYEVSPVDPLTFIAAPLLLGGAAMLACYIPARRAARVHPMTALRNE
jgi:putative ABC transport system permease protein